MPRKKPLVEVENTSTDNPEIVVEASVALKEAADMRFVVTTWDNWDKEHKITAMFAEEEDAETFADDVDMRVWPIDKVTFK